MLVSLYQIVHMQFCLSPLEIHHTEVPLLVFPLPYFVRWVQKLHCRSIKIILVKLLQQLGSVAFPLGFT